MVRFSLMQRSPYHIIVGIFEMHNNVNATMTIQVKVLLNSFDLFNKVIMSVKNEWLNIVTFTFGLTCVHL